MNTNETAKLRGDIVPLVAIEKIYVNVQLEKWHQVLEDAKKKCEYWESQYKAILAVNARLSSEVASGLRDAGKETGEN